MNKIVILLLPFLMLMSSIGIVLNKHYCMGEHKSSALFFDAQPCHSKKAKKVCPMHAKSGDISDYQKPNDCCDDESEYLSLEIDKQINLDQFELEPSQPLSILFLEVQRTEISSVDIKTLRYLNYIPPPLIFELQSQLQRMNC